MLGGADPRSAADPPVGRCFRENSVVVGELLWYAVLPPATSAHLRNRAASFSHVASPQQPAVTPSVPEGRAQLRTGIWRPGSIAGRSPQWSVLPSPTGHCRHGRGRHSAQRQRPGTLCLACLVVMPNHVHLLATPAVALPQLMKSLKGITAKRANAMLALTGSSFWQEESYDHLVRHEQEFEKIRNYIEENPVRAGLVREASEYRWSSAGWATRGSLCGPGGPPHRAVEKPSGELTIGSPLGCHTARFRKQASRS